MIKISKDIKYIGVNDYNIDLFEGQYPVKNGMAYNSYAIIDEKTAIMDTVDASFGKEWLDNIQKLLGENEPDYLVVQHMEPDHSANIANFMEKYPNTKIVASAKAFAMMKNFFGTDFADRQVVVGEGDTLSLGKHNLTFVTAPMVHWPEVIVTYDSTDKVLFSADGFGKFGTIDADEPWADEARRYYIGIVGKYGVQVSNLLKKAATLDIRIICPLHGPVLNENLNYYLDLYKTWASYDYEEEGVTIAYSSVYGNTEKAAKLLADELRLKGNKNVTLFNLNRCDISRAVSYSFRYSKLVLATITYNGDVFPSMREMVAHLIERNFQNRTIAIIENGSWAAVAGKTIKSSFEKNKNITFTDTSVKIMSALNEENINQIKMLADELSK